MNVCDGYLLDQPSVFLPWSTTRDELRALLAGWQDARFDDASSAGSRRVAWLRCASLGNLWHSLVIVFEDDVLTRFELSVPEGCLNEHGAVDFDVSFPLFQQHLEVAFGTPTLLRSADQTSTFTEGHFPECVWRIGDVTVRHAVDEYWGPVEHLTIRREA